MGKSPIQWTNQTWNPVVGCKRVSAGCDHCYAFALHDKRHIAWKRGTFPTAPAQYHKPFSQVQLLPERLDDPLHWRKPRMVFVNSMSDLFHDDVPDDFIAQVFAVMAIASNHTFQILTKRPERMRLLMGDDTFVGMVDTHIDVIGRKHDWPCIAEVEAWPLPNVWLGVSVENQQAADERIPLLLETPAAVRFLSCEPLLGPVDITGCGGPHEYLYPKWLKREHGTVLDGWTERLLHWVIVGGESGPHSRPMQEAWAESLLDQCQAAGIPAFMKQMGTVWARTYHAKDGHGGTPSEWPEHLRVREFPTEVR